MGSIAPALALGSRFALAAVLVYAAVSKWRDRRELPAQVEALGIPRRAARPVAAALPPIEAAVAVALLAYSRSAAPAWAALALFGVFTALIVRAVPRQIPCPCFGAAGDRPVGPRTIVRNAVLSAGSVLATGSSDGATAGGTLVAGLAASALFAAVIRITE